MSGVGLAWSSPVIAILESDDISRIPLGRNITKEEESWIGSLTPVGGVFGPPLFGYLYQAIGRKWTNTLTILPYLLAFLIAAFAKIIWLFYIARILMGVGVGGVFTVIGIYVAEVADYHQRGLLCSSVTCFIMAGMLFVYSIGPFVSIMVLNLVLLTISLAYVPMFLLIGCESPSYLAGKNKDDKALKVLQRLRYKTDKEHQEELDRIHEYLNTLNPGTYLDIFRSKASIKSLVYSIILTTFQQFCGIIVIISYAQNIFDASRSEIPPEYCPIIVAAAQFVASFATPLFADRIGRKKMLLTAIPGATVAELVLGTYFYMQKRGDDVSVYHWLPVSSLVVYIVFYNFGMGSLPWVIMAEILPTNVASKAAALITSFYWIIGFLLTKYFGAMSDAIGMAGSFWMYAACNVLWEMFVYWFMFETKSRSLMDIQHILNE